MAASVKAMVDSVAECAICMEPMSSPKLLHCAHSFCEGCLAKMDLRGGVIVCPTCRHQTPVPPEGISHLRSDFRTAQLREIAAKLSRCDGCSVKLVSVYCLQCQKRFCTNCLRKHNGARAFNKHTILQADALQECSTHGDYVSHVCRDCRALVCATCLMTDCANHDCTEVGAAARAVRNEESDLEGIYGQRLSNLDRRYINARHDIVDKADKMVEKIVERKISLLSDLSTSHDEVIRTIRTEKHRSLQLRRELAVRDLQEGIPRALMELLPTMPSLNDDFSEDSRELLGSLDSDLRIIEQLGLLSDIARPDGDIPDRRGQGDLSQDQTMTLDASRTSDDDFREFMRTFVDDSPHQLNFRCRRVVRDSRKANSSLVGYFKSKYWEPSYVRIIVRMDYPFNEEESTIEIMDDREYIMKSGFAYQKSVVDRSGPDVKHDFEYANELDIMRERVRKYSDVQTSVPQWEFDKIVEDYGNDQLVGKYGDFVVICIPECGGPEASTMIESDNELVFRKHERCISECSDVANGVSADGLLLMKRSLESNAIARYYSIPYLHH